LQYEEYASVKKLRVTVNGVSYEVEVEVLEDDEEGGAPYGFPPATGVSQRAAAPAASPSAAAPKPSSSPTPAPAEGGGKVVTSPIAGVVAEVKVSVGNEVKENDLLIIIEAMKMHTNISSPSAGKVSEIKVKAGDAVQQGQVLVTFE
jgi:biotin carboxyl carrier protein